jgi:Tfp pilus assembly protein PilF
MSYQWSRAIGQEKIIVGDLFSVGGFASRMAIAGMAILHYLSSIVWPVNLLPIYPRWEVDPPKAWMFLAWPVIIGGAWWMWKNRDALAPPHWGRHALFAFGFFLLMVAPVLGFVTISYMRITWVADHFIYLPMISIIALLCAGVVRFFGHAQEASKPTFLAGGALLLAALSLLSFRDAINWMDEDHMWEYTLKHNFEAWQAHNRLGAKKFARGDVDGAHFHFQNSTRLRPDLGETHNNLGTTLSARAQMLAQRGDQAAAKREMDAAIEQFAEACRVTPHVPAIHVNLANALAAAGRFGEAGDKYKELINKEPGNPALINNYGVALYKQGKKDEAIVQFRKALEIAPNMKDARESLAVALGEKPDPTANQPKPPPPPGGQLQLGPPPTSPTLGPAQLP